MNSNNRLPWLSYNWCASSLRPDGSTVNFFGHFILDRYPTEVTLRAHVAGEAAHVAEYFHAGWDPFNVNLLVKPSGRDAK